MIDTILNKNLITLQAILPNDNEIIKILKYCRFKPIEPTLMKWMDLGNNILTINKENINLHSLKIRTKNINEDYLITNIHLKSPISKIMQESSYCFISLLNKAYNMYLLKNNELMFFHYRTKWINNLLPIYGGLIELRNVIKYMNVKNYERKNNNWAFKLPMNQFLKQEPLLKKIFDKCGV